MSGHLDTWGNLLAEHHLLGRSWKTTDGAIDSEFLARILTAIRDGFSTASLLAKAAIERPKPCDRRVDRALGLLSRRGLIHHDRTTKPGRWVLGSAARSAARRSGGAA